MKCDNFDNFRKGYKIQFLKKNMISSKKYMMMSIGLSAIFVMAIMPSNASPDEGNKFYGVAELTKYDVQGDQVFQQSVHNRLVDTGETFLLQGAFNEGTTIANATAIGAICVTNAKITDLETETAATFDGDNTITEANCENGNTTETGGVATLGPLNFEAATGDNNLGAGDTVAGIGICQSSGDGTDFINCATEGILFAQVNTSNVTLASGETVDITYTFDISSPSD
jgi:hypothetical protein